MTEIFERIKDCVEQVLKEFPETRDNDFLLTIHVYLKMGFAHRIPLGVVIHYDKIQYAPAWETITRIRREIQNNEGRFQASNETQIKRMLQETSYHTKYSPRSRADTFPNSQFSP